MLKRKNNTIFHGSALKNSTFKMKIVPVHGSSAAAAVTLFVYILQGVLHMHKTGYVASSCSGENTQTNFKHISLRIHLRLRAYTVNSELKANLIQYEWKHKQQQQQSIFKIKKDVKRFHSLKCNLSTARSLIRTNLEYVWTNVAQITYLKSFLLRGNCEHSSLNHNRKCLHCKHTFHGCALPANCPKSQTINLDFRYGIRMLIKRPLNTGNRKLNYASACPDHPSVDATDKKISY
ncbi:hypothetical protein GQX74_008133 [Glossina fuscipes]|nr:hypothetical protein GQX74_008133 [Glossina fuscipes]